MSSQQIHSTGRGGAGNIGSEEVQYQDASIRREGREGVAEGPAEFSTGRGGAGNIVHDKSAEGKRADAKRTDHDVVPDPDNRKGQYSEFHTGRGGEGNIYKEKYGGHSSKQDQDLANESVKTRIKHAVGLDKK